MAKRTEGRRQVGFLGHGRDMTVERRLVGFPGPRQDKVGVVSVVV